MIIREASKTTHSDLSKELAKLGYASIVMEIKIVTFKETDQRMFYFVATHKDESVFRCGHSLFFTGEDGVPSELSPDGEQWFLSEYYDRILKIVRLDRASLEKK